MIGIRLLLAATLAAAVSVLPAAGQPAQAPPPAPVPAPAPAPAPAPVPAPLPAPGPGPSAQASAPTSYSDGHFATSDLAGGGVNELLVPVLPTQLFELPQGSITWNIPKELAQTRLCQLPKENPQKIFALSKVPHPDKERFSGWTVISFKFPDNPCWWPLRQSASLIITGKVGADGKPANEVPLFKGSVELSVFWFPFLLTLLAVLIIYPGCAMAAWYAGQRRHQKEVQGMKPGDKSPKAAPSFLASLDPVEMTKNAYGRGSVAKLQIYLFTIIIFALLLFYVLRTGVIANMSTSVLLLLGISAAGAVGGKIAYVARRRISLENWAWLRRKKWLPPEGDVTPRAKWSDLFLDSDTKEFDPYSFQMAVFSVIVAVALIKAGLSGLGTFTIPNELLALLGISQTVFIGGRAIDKGGYAEFDKKLDEVRKHEADYQELITKAKAAAPATDAEGKSKPVSTDGQAQPPPVPAGSQAPPNPPPPPPLNPPPTLAEAEVERKAFKTSVRQAAEMFWAIYGEQLPGGMSPELKNADAIEPELYERTAQKS